jgi:hypothetical protein
MTTHRPDLELVLEDSEPNYGRPGWAPNFFAPPPPEPPPAPLEPEELEVIDLLEALRPLGARSLACAHFLLWYTTEIYCSSHVRPLGSSRTLLAPSPKAAGEQRLSALDPVADTVNFAVPMPKAWLDAFFAANKHQENVCLVRNKENGEMEKKWEKYHAKYEQSWWSSMVLLRRAVVGLGDCLWVNYSYHKWHGITNAFNYRLPLNFAVLWSPVSKVLSSFGVPGNDIETMSQICVLRRIDLSVNLKSGDLPVKDLLRQMARFRVQYQESARMEGNFETLYWGTKNSAFLIKVYDKNLEVKRHFFGPEATETEKKFYICHKEDFERTLRFEVGFRSRFWKQDGICEKRGLAKMMTNGKRQATGEHKRWTYRDEDREAVGEQGINSVLMHCGEKMRGLFDRVFSQFETANMDFDDQWAFAKVQQNIEESSYRHNMKMGMQSLVSKSWLNGYDQVKKEFPNDTFFRYKKILKNEFNWDIKVMSGKNAAVMEELKKRASEERQSERVKLEAQGFSSPLPARDYMAELRAALGEQLPKTVEEQATADVAEKFTQDLLWDMKGRPRIYITFIMGHFGGEEERGVWGLREAA